MLNAVKITSIVETTMITDIPKEKDPAAIIAERIHSDELNEKILANSYLCEIATENDTEANQESLAENPSNYPCFFDGSMSFPSETPEERVAKDILDIIKYLSFGSDHAKSRVDNGSRGTTLKIIETIQNKYNIQPESR